MANEMRDRLVELLNKTFDAQYTKSMLITAEHTADHLIENGVVVPQWISVKDRLPEEDGKYIVARREGSCYSISVRKFRKEVPCWYTGYCGHWERRTNAITHWMPLPKPPQAEQKLKEMRGE